MITDHSHQTPSAADANRSSTTTEAMDPVLVSILANRIDGIVREMSNTLLRTARSTVIAAARDFSCAIVTHDNQLLATAEGLPIHMFGAHLLCEAMTRLHPNLAEGDAFIHNDPYLGNTHAADQTILVPIFIEGEHLFTACAKAHQADIGNAIPTTYHAGARDVYEEGAVIFPCMKLQSNGEMIDDVVRMGMTRIRVPEQWYGDLLAAVGSARIGERQLKALCKKYGSDTVKTFIQVWFDYSEQRAQQAIAALPPGRIQHQGVHDPIPPVIEQPVPVNVIIDIDPQQGRINVDLRDNIDCLPCGLNQSEACAISSAMIGVFNCLGDDVPQNAGAFRRLAIQLREGSALGKVTHPHSASVATAYLAARIINTIQSAFAQLGYGHGLSEGSNCGGADAAVISGKDRRRGNSPYVNQIILNAMGGPASAVADGWQTFTGPETAGLIYRDSVELDELKQPLLVEHIRISTDTAGAGYRRGGAALDVAYRPRFDEMTAVFTSDNTCTPPRGVLGGYDGCRVVNSHRREDGSVAVLPAMCMVTLQPGESIRTQESSGGGYGPPDRREPERVLNDVLSGVVSLDAARDIYRVALQGQVADESLTIDTTATAALRSSDA